MSITSNFANPDPPFGEDADPVPPFKERAMLNPPFEEDDPKQSHSLRNMRIRNRSLRNIQI